METVRYTDNNGVFYAEDPDCVKGLYFPIAGEKGLKSVLTPTGGGDSKLDQNTFIMEPVSIENLHNNRSGRNFWCRFENGGYWSALGASAEAEMRRAQGNPEKNSITAGFMWQCLERESEDHHIRSQILSLADDETDTEIMSVRLVNTGNEACVFTPFAALPVYGRSADNIRDHRHVTSLLHRIRTVRYGIEVTPTLSFDERGHRRNTKTYYAYGIGPGACEPTEFFPTVDSYIGESGTYTCPEAVVRDLSGVGKGEYIEGREAIGGMKFDRVRLESGESVDFILFLGISEGCPTEEWVKELIGRYDSYSKVISKKQDVENYWNRKVNIRMETGDRDFDMLMRWVCFQPYLRRIYGCSFLPHHDYGKGGRGWRDLWQDCLALLIMDPSDVRKMIVSNFSGVRADGTNATIIGSQPGEFKADRNGITRVWMDHGMWPMQTVKLYLDQCGDHSVLLEQVAYFKDGQTERGKGTDGAYAADRGTYLETESGEIYRGTILEHLLVQNITAAFDTGDHGIMNLRDADWNDALDMAGDKGESVAFTCAYAENLKNLAGIIRENRGGENIELMEELTDLIDSDMAGEGSMGFGRYLAGTGHTVSGAKKSMPSALLADYLEGKAEKIMSLIRRQEWLEVKEDNETFGWFNSYYDNSGKAVEGKFGNNIRMMLTGQVFSIMSGTATDDQVKDIVKAADSFLYEKKIGGYRLNTDFREEKYDMGRAFGFAYGEKENGAVFSHMTVMYAYALYKRGFAREGYKALQTLADAAMNFNTAHIYPGIPEYFNNDGRGLYSYLTGAASWYALTMVTQVYGVRGNKGNPEIAPQLLGCQFNEEGRAALDCTFGGSELHVEFVNEERLDPDEYMIGACLVDGAEITGDNLNGSRQNMTERIVIPAEKIGPAGTAHRIEIRLCKNRQA